MKASLHWIFCFLALLPASGTAFGYRPFLTDDAGVAGRGVLQIEEGWDYFDWHDSRHDNFLITSLVYGVLAPLELTATFPYEWHREAPGHTSGWSDIGGSAKLQLLPDKDCQPALTLKGYYKSDSGAFPSLGTGEKDWGALLLATKSFSRWTLHANAGHSWIGQTNTSSLDDWQGGLGADYAVVKAWHAIAEVTGARYPTAAPIDNGLIGALGGWVQLGEWGTMDLFVRRGWGDSVPRWNPGAGFTVAWK